jgi:hypothetical protein
LAKGQLAAQQSGLPGACDMKVVIEMFAAPAILGETCHAWMALAIMADATEVASGHIGEEDVGAEVDGLSSSLEAPTSARKFAQTIVPLIVTRTLASFGIASLVTSSRVGMPRIDQDLWSEPVPRQPSTNRPDHKISSGAVKM